MPVFFSSPAVCATALHCFSSSSPAIRQSQHSRVRLSSPEVPAALNHPDPQPGPANGLCLFTASLPQLGLFFILSQLFITGTTDGRDNAKHALSPHLRGRKLEGGRNYPERNRSKCMRQLATRNQLPCLLKPVLKNVLADTQNSMKRWKKCAGNTSLAGMVGNLRQSCWYGRISLHAICKHANSMACDRH